MAAMLSSVLRIVEIFEQRAETEGVVREQLDAKISSLLINLEFIVKLLFFSPLQLSTSSISLVHQLLKSRRFKKLGVFAIYCTALMIQEEQQECVKNLVPVFTDPLILETLFDSIRAVDSKYAEL